MKNLKTKYLKHELTRSRVWPYQNTTLLLLSFVLLFVLAKTPYLQDVIDHAGNLGYFGAFITGVFFVSTFTAVPAGYVLFNLADHLHPLEVALLAGLGAMIGDYIILRVIKDKVFDELKPIIGKVNHPMVRNIFKTPLFAWLLPVIGALIIASPLPDEAGVSILGISKIKKWQFFLVTYTLNAIGIFIIAVSSQI